MFDLPRLLKETSSEIVRRQGGDSISLAALPDDLVIDGIAPLDSAGPFDLSFITNARFKPQLMVSTAGLVIMNEGFLVDFEGLALVHKNPYWVYAHAACLFEQARDTRLDRGFTSGVAGSAVVAGTADVSASCSIGHGAVISDRVLIDENTVIGEQVFIGDGVKIGARCRIAPGAKILQDCVLGDDVFIDSGAVIGSEGFGYAPYQSAENGSRRWQRIAQLGKVVIGSRVSIGASTTVDRGALDDTVIGDDVIIDNQVQVAHNTRIGAGSAIAGCVGIAGSSIIGERCNIGGGAGIAGHLSIADDTVVLGMTLINKTVKHAGVYASGTGMQDAGQWRKSAVRFTQLDELHNRVKALERARVETSE